MFHSTTTYHIPLVILPLRHLPTTYKRIGSWPTCIQLCIYDSRDNKNKHIYACMYVYVYVCLFPDCFSFVIDADGLCHKATRNKWSNTRQLPQNQEKPPRPNTPMQPGVNAPAAQASSPFRAYTRPVHVSPDFKVATPCPTSKPVPRPYRPLGRAHHAASRMSRGMSSTSSALPANKLRSASNETSLQERLHLSIRRNSP